MSDSEELNQMFAVIKQDLEKTPPETTKIPRLIEQFANGLQRFVPSKKNLHEQIEKDLLIKPFIAISVENFPHIVSRLIYWIKKFQAPIYDTVTDQWAVQLAASKTPSDIVKFFEEFYYHSQEMYRQVWEARKRLVTGENIIPPEHRPKHTGSDGIPHNMKTGK